MRGGSSREVVRQLRTLYQFGVAGSFGDEQLLGRFLASRDEAAEEAFAELVRRHGPMVLGVCRRILGDAHDAEDAFQATFLVLARKAASVARREKVASWLYGVAVRTAKEARVRSARRRAREERVSTPIHVEPPDDGFPDELRAILDEELARLPAKHRGPVVLCELEGLSRPEAARRLGIAEGTLSSRLARARARLRDRLSARGVTLPVAAVSALLIREARSATVPLSLFESTVQAATLVAASPGSVAIAALSLSAPVASLSEGVIKTMLVAKLKGVALVVGTLTAAVPVAVVVAQSGGKPAAVQAPPAAPAEDSAAKPPAPAPTADPAAKPSAPAPGEIVPTIDGPTPLSSAPDGLTPVPGPTPMPVAPPQPQPEDRTAALEKKLDRVIEALQHLSPPNGPPPPATFGKPPALDATPTVLEPAPSSNPPPMRIADNGPQLSPPTSELQPLPPHRVTPENTPRPVVPGWLQHMPPHRVTLSSRLESLEQQMQQVQHRLDLLDKRLKAIDARVGGGEGDVTIPPVIVGPPPSPIRTQ